jgi:hypothetical protein
MSAYVVEDLTINKIVSFLYLKDQGDRYYGPARLVMAAGYDLGTEEGRVRLAVRMFALNVRAVNARYGLGAAKTFRPLTFKHHLVHPPSEAFAYVSLGCWLYQCSEGKVPETRLFKLMSSVCDSMAHNLADRLPEVQKAPWG